MIDPVGDTSVRITVCRPECCIGHGQGMVLSVWSSPVRGYLLQDVERAVREAARETEGGVTTLSVYRLDRRFPVGPDADADLDQIWRTLRTLRPLLRGSASVLEFNGLIASMVRQVVEGLELITRRAVQLPVFDRAIDALLWLQERTVNPASLRFYQTALRTIDQTHAAWLEENDPA